MDGAVLWRDHWSSQVGVVELDGVYDADSLGGGIYGVVAAVVVENRADAETVTGAEVP